MVTPGEWWRSRSVRETANDTELIKTLRPDWSAGWGDTCERFLPPNETFRNECSKPMLNFFFLVNVILYISTLKLQIRKGRYGRKRRMKNGDDMLQGQRLHAAPTVNPNLILAVALYNNRCSHYLDFARMRSGLDMQSSWRSWSGQKKSKTKHLPGVKENGFCSCLNHFWNKVCLRFNVITPYWIYSHTCLNFQLHAHFDFLIAPQFCSLN